MMKIIRPVAIAGGVLAITAMGATGVAFAGGAEPEGDQAAQDTACEKAGISSSASNIQYDDETRVCTLDGGSGDNED